MIVVDVDPGVCGLPCAHDHCQGRGGGYRCGSAQGRSGKDRESGCMR